MLEIKNPIVGLDACITYVPVKSQHNETSYKLKINIVESLKITGNTTCLKYLTGNNQYVNANTVIAKIEILSQSGGTLVGVEKTNTSTAILVLKEKNIKNEITNIICCKKR